MCQESKRKAEALEGVGRREEKEEIMVHRGTDERRKSRKYENNLAKETQERKRKQKC